VTDKRKVEGGLGNNVVLETWLKMSHVFVGIQLERNFRPSPSLFIYQNVCGGERT
jgi:hypothetical protein